jgi:hypothetical protein
MAKRSVPTRQGNSDAVGRSQRGEKVSTVGLALSRRDVVAILVTGLLLLLLVLSGVAPGELGVARPTDVVGSAAVPAGRCDLGTPCATEIAAAAHAPCAASTPCAPDTVTAPATADELLGPTCCTTSTVRACRTSPPPRTACPT